MSCGSRDLTRYKRGLRLKWNSNGVHYVRAVRNIRELMAVHVVVVVVVVVVLVMVLMAVVLIDVSDHRLVLGSRHLINAELICVKRCGLCC